MEENIINLTENSKEKVDGQGSFKLSKPIKLNGEMASELEYNFDDMTAKDKFEVSRYMAQNGFNVATFERLDPVYNMLMFAVSVSKVSQGEISVDDVLRISAKDTAAVSELVKSFFY